MKLAGNGYLVSLVMICGFVAFSAAEESLDEAGSKTKRVINGSHAAFGQFPYVVRIEMMLGDSKAICTGSLITTETVITAAHCFINHAKGEGFIPVEHCFGYLGSVKWSDTRNEVTFKERRIHEDYLKTINLNDIAVLILDSPVQLNEFIQLIALPDEGQTFVGSKVTAVGWGLSTFEGRRDRLRYLEGTVDSSVGCRPMLWNYMSPKIICLEQGRDACVFQGDSGGPLVKMYGNVEVCIGVLIGGTGHHFCSFPALFTSLSAHNDWIRKNAVGNVTFVKF